MKTTITNIACDFCGKDISEYVPFEVVQEMEVREGTGCYHLYLGIHFCNSTCFFNAVAKYFNKKV